MGKARILAASPSAKDGDRHQKNKNQDANSDTNSDGCHELASSFSVVMTEAIRAFDAIVHERQKKTAPPSEHN